MMVVVFWVFRIFLVVIIFFGILIFVGMCGVLKYFFFVCLMLGNLLIVIFLMYFIVLLLWLCIWGNLNNLGVLLIKVVLVLLDWNVG